MTSTSTTPTSVNPPSWTAPPSWAPPSPGTPAPESLGQSSPKQSRIASLERLIAVARDRGDRAEYERLVDHQARFCGSIGAFEELAETYPLERALESIPALDNERCSRTRQLLETARKGGLQSPYEIEVMARCYYLVGEIGAALDLFDELLEGNMGKGHIHRYRGVCLLGQGAWLLAQYAFEDALGHDPDCALSFRGKGEAMIQVGPLNQAVHYLRKSLRKSPRDGHTFFLLGEALYALGHISEASVAYSRSVRLAPLDKRNIHRHARTLMQLGRSVEAIEVLDAAHEQELCATEDRVQRALWAEAQQRERQAAADQAAQAKSTKPKPKPRPRKRRNLLKYWLSKPLYPY